MLGRRVEWLEVAAGESMAMRLLEMRNRGGAWRRGVASSCGASRWRLGGMPNGGAGQPVGGGSNGGEMAAEQSSSGAGGRRRSAGT